MFGRHVWFFYI